MFEIKRTFVRRKKPYPRSLCARSFCRSEVTVEGRRYSGILLAASDWGVRSLAVVSFAVAKTQATEQRRSGSGAYFPLEQLPPLSDSDGQLLGDALMRSLLPRGVLHRKTDGFDGRSPLAIRIGVYRAETPAPVL